MKESVEKMEPSVYTLLAEKLGLKRIEKNTTYPLWVDSNGVEYIQTTFGFRAGEHYNNGLLVKKLQNELEDVSEKLVSAKRHNKILEQELKKYKPSGRIKTHADKITINPEK